MLSILPSDEIYSMGGPIALWPPCPLVYNMGTTGVFVEMHRNLILLYSLSRSRSPPSYSTLGTAVCLGIII